MAGARQPGRGLTIKAAKDVGASTAAKDESSLDAGGWTLLFGFELIIGTSPTHSRIFDR